MAKHKLKRFDGSTWQDFEQEIQTGTLGREVLLIDKQVGTNYSSVLTENESGIATKITASTTGKFLKSVQGGESGAVNLAFSTIEVNDLPIHSHTLEFITGATAGRLIIGNGVSGLTSSDNLTFISNVLKVGGQINFPTTNKVHLTENGISFFSTFRYGLSDNNVQPAGQNTFVGLKAGNTTMGKTATATSHASYNTALGYAALNSNTTGSNNTALGYYAGMYLADGSTGNANSTSSIFIGYNSKAQADNQSNQIVIGYTAVGEGSNTVVLGNTSITKTYLRGDIYTTTGSNFWIGGEKVFGSLGLKLARLNTGTGATPKVLYEDGSQGASKVSALSPNTYLKAYDSGSGNIDLEFASIPTYTFYNLDFANSSGTVQATYKPTTSPSKTLKAGSNISFSVSGDVITLASSYNDTTYTFANGNLDGTFRVTPSGGSTQNIAIGGLGSAAYTASTDYAISGHKHSATDITSGVLGITYGGTGFSTVAGNGDKFLKVNSAGTAFEFSSISLPNVGTLGSQIMSLNTGTGATPKVLYEFGNVSGGGTIAKVIGSIDKAVLKVKETGADTGQFELEFIPLTASDIVSGTLTATQGGTGLNSYTKGDLLHSSASNTIGKLGVGSTGQFLTVSDGLPAWINLPVANGTTTAGVVSTTTQEFGGAKTFSSVLKVSATTASTSKTTGALIVSGGVGISGKLYLGDDIDLASSKKLTVGGTAGTTGQVLTSGTTGIPAWEALPVASGIKAGIVSIGSQTFAGVKTFNSSMSISATSESSSTTSGALTVSGGVGIAKRLYVGGFTNFAGNVNLSSSSKLTVNSVSGTNGQVLTSNASGIPSWQTPTSFPTPGTLGSQIYALNTNTSNNYPGVLIEDEGHTAVKVYADGVGQFLRSYDVSGGNPSLIFGTLSGADITSGTLIAKHGGTGQTSWSTGQMMYASGTDTLTKLNIGTTGKILRSSGTAPTWTTLTMPTSITKGAIFVANTANTLTAVGSTSGTKVLTNTAGSISWETPSGGGGGGQSYSYKNTALDLRYSAQTLTLTASTKIISIMPHIGGLVIHPPIVLERMFLVGWGLYMDTYNGYNFYLDAGSTDLYFYQQGTHNNDYPYVEVTEYIWS